MSTYYCFYLAKKDSDNKIDLVGPYIRKEDGTYSLRSLHERSQSFIHWNDDFVDFMDPLPIESMGEAAKRFLTYEDGWTGKTVSNAYICPWGDMANASAEAGLRIGYIPLDSFNYVIKNHYSIEDIYDIEFMTPEQMAEYNRPDKDEWGKIAFFERNSGDYIADQIITASRDLTYNHKDYYIVCNIC